MKKILNDKLFQEIPKVLNLIFLAMRKINEEITVSAFKTKDFQLRTSDILKSKERLEQMKLPKEKLYEILQALMKSLILIVLKNSDLIGDDKLLSEEIRKKIPEKCPNQIYEFLDNQLELLIFNEDLVFDHHFENKDFLSALIFILWQKITSKYIYLST